MLNSCLTSNREKGIFEFPNFVRRSNRLFSLPRTEKSIVAYSAAEVATIPGGLLSHIGRVATSSIREDWRLHEGRGELCPAFFIFPKLREVPMFQFFPSHRFQRLQSHLQSFFTNFIHKVATGSLFDVSPCLPEEAYQAHKEAAHVNA